MSWLIDVHRSYFFNQLNNLTLIETSVYTVLWYTQQGLWSAYAHLQGSAFHLQKDFVKRIECSARFYVQLTKANPENKGECAHT